VVNGRVAATSEVLTDGQIHEVHFSVAIDRSSWVALRHFPELHTNPVEVRVGGRPIRASRRSALWCADVVEHLWRSRGRAILPAEREEARKAFDRAVERYRQIAAEAADDRP
jgi:hypothetical protein